MVQQFRSTTLVMPGGRVGTNTIPNRPLTVQEQLQFAQAGIFINPVTGVPAFAADPAETERKRRVRQDLAFAQAVGGQLQQLGIQTPSAEGSGFLRPEQIGALLALRRGDDPVPVLSSLGGTPIPSFPPGGAAGGAFPSGPTFSSFSGGGGEDFFAPTTPPEAAEPPRTGLPSLPVLGAAAAAVGVLVLLASRRGS